MKKVLLALALVGATAAAAAQDGKGYVGVGAGVSRFDVEGCDGLPSGLECDDTGFAWNFRAGYHFFPWLAVEGAFLDFGKAAVPGVLLNPPPGTVPVPTESDLRASGFVASLVGRLPLGPVGVVGRVGWGAITGKFSGRAAVMDVGTGAVQYFDAETRNTTGQLVYGVGATVDLGRSLAARVDWDRTKAKDGLNPKYDVDMITAGVAYRF